MQIIRQSIILLRQNPLLSTISILGTAFAITMIMSIVITWQTKYSNIEPEINRERCLYISGTHMYSKENKNSHSYGSCSPALMKEFIQPIQEVEAYTAIHAAQVALASMPDGMNRVKVDAMKTDQGFWKVFHFQFLSGRGFTEADRGGEMNPVVISASIARKLFGTTDVAGKSVLLNREEARICGVVKDVSVTSKDAYAQIWSMYPEEELKVTSLWSYKGSKCIVMLAHTSGDFPIITEKLKKHIETINAGSEDTQLSIMEQPDNIVAHVNHTWSNVGPDLPMLYLQYGIALIIILMVPSLNLCGLSNSRMQQRVSELGVRKAFGATRSVLIRQILNENLVLTFIGGLIGLLFSYLAVYAMRTWLFTNSGNVGTSGDFSLSMSTLFSPTVFCLAFAFCLLINLFSAGLPAWLAAKRTIVDSLNDK